MCLGVMCQRPGREPGRNNLVEGNESVPREKAGREQLGGGQCVSSQEGGRWEGTMCWRVMHQPPKKGAGREQFGGG